MAKADPHGHYQALNLSPGASPAEIRLAYEFLKTSYREGRKRLEISRIRAAYEILSDPKRRRAYDRGEGPGQSPSLGEQLGKLMSKVNLVPVGLVVLLVGSIVLFAMIGPNLRAQFVSFDRGDQLVWSSSGDELGSVVAFEEAHQFVTGTVAPAYQIRPPSGEDPVWYPARDLERHCSAR